MPLVKPADRPLVFGHRGASAEAEDNTVEALRLAVDAGADGVEIDVRFTADGEIVLHHDPAIAGYGVIVAKPFRELRAAQPEVPTLDEGLEACAEMYVNVEIKNDPSQPDFDGNHRMADAIVEWIHERQLQDRVLVSSFNHDTVNRVRELDPLLMTGQLLSRSAHLEAEVELAEANGHGWVIPHRRHFARDGELSVSLAREHGLGVVVWTVDGKRRLAELRDAGVDGVITNDPRRALAVYS